MKICNDCIKRSVCKYTESYSEMEQVDKPLKITLTCDERLEINAKRADTEVAVLTGHLQKALKQGGAFA